MITVKVGRCEQLHVDPLATTYLYSPLSSGPLLLGVGRFAILVRYLGSWLYNASPRRFAKEATQGIGDMAGGTVGGERKCR